ncbi:MAG: hypothetical protein ACTTHG_03505 [Treponemataceae bacterium]
MLFRRLNLVAIFLFIILLPAFSLSEENFFENGKVKIETPILRNFEENEFSLGLDYMFYLELAKYNNKTFSNLAHGFALNFEYRLYFHVSAISYLGLGFNLDIGLPFAINTNMNGQKNILLPTNCQLKALVTDYSIGFASKHLCEQNFWFEWYAGLKIGVFSAEYKQQKQITETKIFNMTTGIQGEFQFTYYFANRIGISGGIRLDYDFFSLAAAKMPESYSYLQIFDIKPFILAKFKI